MNSMSSIKRICITAVCIALCSILPMAFHSVGLGTAFSPMHIPVLLCGLVCGSSYGIICGTVGPLLSSVLTGMPGAAMLPTMVPELAVYGLVTGLMMKYIRTSKPAANLYISLISAMVLGRIVGGMAKALFYLGTSQAYNLSLWASGYFVGTLPGIVCHLIVVPILVSVLMKARLIPVRYTKIA